MGAAAHPPHPLGAVPVSKNKQKGTLAETAVVDYLRLWFPGVERRALAGVNDRGDVAGIPRTVLEVKNHGVYDFPAWLREAQVEADNASAKFYASVVKPRGVGATRVGDWWAVTSLNQYALTLFNALANRP